MPPNSSLLSMSTQPVKVPPGRDTPLSAGLAWSVGAFNFPDGCLRNHSDLQTIQPLRLEGWNSLVGLVIPKLLRHPFKTEWNECGRSTKPLLR